MTSEVLLMNRGAVAMAADSAVTITSERSQTIYKSVDKVFQLIADRPIGVMIYNNAEVMTVPWETIISMYKEEAVGRTFDTIEEYAEDFFAFLDNNRNLFPEKNQDFEFYRIVGTIYGLMAYEFDRQLQFIADQGASEDVAVNATSIFEFVVNEFHRLYSDAERPFLKCFAPDAARRLAARYRDGVASLIDALNTHLKNNHPKLALSEKTRKSLFEIAIMAVTKDAFFEGYTGLVFAGFGRKDKFPTMASYYASGVIDSKLKRVLDQKAAVEENGMPVVMTFAHDDMIHTFMTGMDRDFRDHVFLEMFHLTSGIVWDLINGLPGLTAEQKQALFEKYSEENLRQTMIEFFHSIRDYQFEKHTWPVVQAIQSLPRMELAETAASLVKLNSFQMKVTAKPETVGGPVHVALISRSEGFVLLKNVGQ